MLRTLRLVGVLACVWMMGCGGDDEAANNSDGGGIAVSELPDSLEKGSELSWNPKITITSDTTFEYQNVGATSPFTASITGGTYTYTVDGDEATLTIDGTSADDGKLLADLPATIALIESGSTSLEIKIGDQSYDGVLTLPAPEGGGGGTKVDGTLPAGAVAAKVNPAFVGSHDLAFGNVQPGAPFDEGAMETFVIGADNTLTAMGKKISNPFYINGNEYEIRWNDGTLTWALSDNQGELNEINLEDSKTHKWLGQWADASKFEEQEPENGIGVQVKMTVTSTGMSGDAVKPPYMIGDEVFVTWDGHTMLMVTHNSASPTDLTFIGQDTTFVAPEGTNQKKRKWTRGNSMSGEEFALVVDDDVKKLVRLEVKVTKSSQSGPMSGTAECEP